MLRYAITPGITGVRQGKADLAERVEDLSGVVARCAELSRSGVEFLVVREKQLLAGDLAGLCRRVLAAVRREGAMKVMVAQRVDVALAVGADGVHLPSGPGELRVEEVRRLFERARLAEPFVSVACHAVDEVRRAREEGASAVLFAPVFGKSVAGVEVAAGVGLERLREACLAAGEMPVFALGGVTEENAAECVEAGAAGVAGIRMFFP